MQLDEKRIEKAMDAAIAKFLGNGLEAELEEMVWQNFEEYVAKPAVQKKIQAAVAEALETALPKLVKNLAAVLKRDAYVTF